MKTARITFLVEVGDFDFPMDGALARAPNFAARIQPLADCRVIGTPKVEVDKYHRCSMSHAQFFGALGQMKIYGGSFTQALSDLLYLADSANVEKLLDTFHDLIWSYVPGGQA